MQIRSCITPILILCTAVMLPAQPPMMNKEARERIEAQRIAFITDQLHLTPDEAARFWPIYNEYKDGLKDLRDEFERLYCLFLCALRKVSAAVFLQPA